MTHCLLTSLALLLLAQEHAIPPSPVFAPGTRPNLILVRDVGSDSVRPIPVVELVRFPSVIKALKLTPVQQQIHRDLGKSIDERLREIDGGRPREAKPRSPELQAWEEKRSSLLAQAEVSVEESLDTQQKTRLRQIKFQVDGHSAFRQAAVLDRLELNERQSERISLMVGHGLRAIEAATSVEFPQTPENPRYDPERFQRWLASPEGQLRLGQNRAAAMRIRANFAADLPKVLTPRQKETLKKMTGRPFDLKTLVEIPAARDSH